MAVGLALQRTIASLTRGGVYGKQQRVQLLWLSVRQRSLCTDCPAHALIPSALPAYCFPRVGGVYGKQQRVQLLWFSVRPYVLRDFVHACLCKGVGFCILPPSLFPHARGGVRKTTTRSGVVVLRTLHPFGPSIK